MSPFSKMGFRRYLQFLSAFSRLVLILSGFTGSSFPDVGAMGQFRPLWGMSAYYL